MAIFHLSGRRVSLIGKAADLKSAGVIPWGFESLTLRGEVAEWLRQPIANRLPDKGRGFESHPLRKTLTIKNHD